MWLYVVVVVGLVALFAVGKLLYQVEDWSRDLSQNYAETSPDARDAALRPIESDRSPQEMAAVVERAAMDLPRWQLAGREAEGNQQVLRLVRTTPLVRYKDDIVVRIEPAESGSRLTASSKSRLGKADFGQNPRNLRELLSAVRGELAPRP